MSNLLIDFTEKISTYSDSQLTNVQSSISRELRKRSIDSITYLKEWSDKNKYRIIQYSYIYDVAQLVCLLVVFDENGRLYYAKSTGSGVRGMKKILKFDVTKQVIHMMGI